jgi:hypothetical protein
MSTLRLIFLCAALLIWSGCSSTHPYELTGEPNFKISFKTGGRFMMKTHLEVSMFEYLPTCKIHYLGTVKLKNEQSQSVYLPKGANVGVRNFLEQGGWWSDVQIHHQDAKPFTFTVAPEASYEFEFEEDAGAIGENYYKTLKGKRTELAPVQFTKTCLTYEDEKK